MIIFLDLDYASKCASATARINEKSGKTLSAGFAAAIMAMVTMGWLVQFREFSA